MKRKRKFDGLSCGVHDGINACVLNFDHNLGESNSGCWFGMPAKSTVRDSNSSCNKRFREKRNKSPSEIVFGFFWIFLNFNKMSYLPSAPVLLKTLDRSCCESGVWGLALLWSKKKKAKNYAVFCFAGKRIFFFYLWCDYFTGKGKKLWSLLLISHSLPTTWNWILLV